jgi:hypothetical protein
VTAWGDFLRGMAKADEGGDGSVLDRTTVLLTSNLGNASSHDNRNMPVLLAGGGFRHGSHLAFDQQKNHPLPTCSSRCCSRRGWSRHVRHVDGHDARSRTGGGLIGLAGLRA